MKKDEMNYVKLVSILDIRGCKLQMKGVQRVENKTESTLEITTPKKKILELVSIQPNTQLVGYVEIRQNGQNITGRTYSHEESEKCYNDLMTVCFN